MTKLTIPPKCCDKDAEWVDNVPGKEYYYCKVCKKEVNPDDIHNFGDLAEAQRYVEDLFADQETLDDYYDWISSVD